jgi:hypothetical protein
MVARIASLFTADASIFTSLEFFHTTLPCMQGTLWDDRSEWNAASDDGNTSEDDDDPHARLPICGITSLSFAMQDDQSVNTFWMRKLRSIIEEAPSLRFLELRYWSATELSGTDESLGEPGRWKATHLSLLECGPITLEVEYVLGMPKDLQSLEIISELTPNVKRSDLDFPISIQEAVGALEPVQTSLVELKFDPGASEHWICPESYPAAWQTLMEVYQFHAFTSLSKLQRLQAPLEMLSQSTGKMRRDENHTFYTNLPPSLEELTLVVTSREPFHQALEGAYALRNCQVVLEDRIVDISNLSCCGIPANGLTANAFSDVYDNWNKPVLPSTCTIGKSKALLRVIISDGCQHPRSCHTRMSHHPSSPLLQHQAMEPYTIKMHTNPLEYKCSHRNTL